MEVTPFKLYELLTNPDAMSPGVNVDSRKLTNYNKTYSYSLDGKIGAQLKLLLDVELEGERLRSRDGVVAHSHQL